MRTRRVLGAALTTALATGLVGAAMPTARAGDNDKADWEGRRVVQLPDAADGPVQVHGGGTDQWSLVARNIGNDTWRLRESVDGSLGYTNPEGAPATITRWQAETTPYGFTIGAYEDAGRLFGYSKEPNGIRGSKELATATAGPIVLDNDYFGSALVAAGDTWHQHFPATQSGNDGDSPRWESYADPNVDGVPGPAGQSFGFTGADLLAFWNDPDGDLRVARRARVDTSAAFSAAQTIAADEKAVRFMQTPEAGTPAYLVTQATDGAVHLYTYTADGTGFSFTDERELVGAGERSAPTVLVDARGTLTVGWQEAGQGGGLVLWQLDRPGSTYLERPTLVPGTRDAEARVVTGPRGNLTVALRRDAERAIVRVKHLPIGKAKWSDGIRLISPKPITDASAGWGIGTPQANNDLRVAVNDQVGVYGFRFDAPSGVTKVTKPVRTRQQGTTYRIGWNTSWTFADDWQVRMRLDKGRRYGAWKQVYVADGAQTKTVTRARGKTWCYEARAFLDGRRVTPWSTQRCVSVRR